MCSEIDSNQGLKGHLVLLTIPAWGSLRPLCGVACRAVQERPDIVVTFMILGGLGEKITAECDRYSRSNDNDDEKEGMRRRLRLVNIGGQGFDIPELMSVAFKSFPDCYRKLVFCESIRSISTGDDIPPTIRPTAVITDNNYLPILQSVREITGKNVPVWDWSSAGAYLPLRVFGSEKYGGLGDVVNTARHVAEATGRDVEEVTKEVGALLPISISVLETDEQLDDEHEGG
ncbi:glycosyltransferase family 1 protein [Piloderma croceum F 1598]|uniref:Glycosyltransferase family 1 protein n=1 Tax=Piloderma croceum (strain F 1598) TaxID=765440 RepID=A0A0C3F0L0_PILCF|nr:glycosyltransferase family 1 protein [Piloderma croceum F 1598]